MIFQMLLGFWLFVSPFATGVDWGSDPGLSNMILGAAVVAMSLWIFLRETSPSCREEICT
jgi:hypothetical protein